MKKKKKPLPTIWEIPDELWKRMAPLILEMDPPKETGRPRANPRIVTDAIFHFYRLLFLIYKSALFGVLLH